MNFRLCVYIAAIAFSSLNFAAESPAQDTAQSVAAMRQKAVQLRQDAETAKTQGEAECNRKFLVNMCLEEIRKTYVEQRKEANRLEIAASDLERKTRVEDAARRKAARQAERAAAQDDPQSPQAQKKRLHEQEQQTFAQRQTEHRQRQQERTRHAADAQQQRTAREQELQQERTKKMEAAAERAAQAREQKAVYEERARKLAEKKAQQRLKASGAPAQP